MTAHAPAPVAVRPDTAEQHAARIRETRAAVARMMQDLHDRRPEGLDAAGAIALENAEQELDRQLAALDTELIHLARR